VFEAPTPAALALAIANLDKALPPIVSLASRDCHPLSHAQRRIWFLVQLQGAESAYNLPAAIRLRGPLSTARLASALQTLVQRHASLRTTFVPINNEPMQWVADSMHIALPCEPIDGDDEPLRLGTVQAKLAAFALEPFNLETGPLLRAQLYRLADDNHVFAFVMHHIVSDGWSIEVAIRELCALYDEPDAPALPPLPLQYVDYAAWQRELIVAGRFAQQRAYWLRQLGGDLPPLQLPTDRPRQALHSFAGAQVVMVLPSELQRSLRALSAERGVTLFMLLLAAYQCLLSRLCGHDDIVVGTPVAGRQQAQLEPQIGFFVNTLALRTPLAGNPSFNEVLDRVRETALQAYANQDYPFDLLVDELGAQRDLSRQAVFNTTFTLQAPAFSRAPLSADSDLIAEGLPFEFAKAKFDLGWTVADNPAAMALEIDYNTDLFDRDTILRFGESYQRLLEAIAVDASIRLAALPLLSEQRRDDVLYGFNANRVDYDLPEDLMTRFERQVARVPNRVAVVCGDDSLSYAELDRRANQLAHHLRQHGVIAEAPVVICLERSVEQVVAIFAVLKAGGCYVPVEPAYPDERIAYMVRDTGAQVAIGKGANADRLATCTAKVVCLARDALQLAEQAAQRPHGRTLVHQLAYIIYTSGSTGRPKGSLISHANVLRLFDACDEHYRFDANDVWTLFHSYGFDFSVWEIFGALLHGGRLVVVPHLVARSPQEMLALMEAQRVTVLSQTPSAFVRLLDSAAMSDRWDWTRSLRYVTFGGEALDPAALRPWFQHLRDPSTKLINMYGITETTVHVTFREVVAADVIALQGRRIGHALADLTLYVLGPTGQPQPIGVAGELHVGGPGLARGYLGQPAVTARSFVPNAFTHRAGARMYRTGDLARFRPDGELEYLGRIDQQVKIRGHRIEPGEVEAALLAHEGVTGALVVAAKDRAQRDNLLVYYAGPEPITTSGLRTFLGRTLPDYMIPHAYLYLREFPLTANGKIDRAKLPHLQSDRPQLDVPYVAPRNALERQLALIWAEVLQVDRIGAKDNFFDLGGESFSAYRLMARISADLGKELPLATIFQAQTVEELSERINTAIDLSEERVLVTLQTGAPGRKPLFCVHPAGGDVLGFQDLARAFGPEQPFYGLQSLGRFLHSDQHTTLEAMAACYVREIQTLQPTGPYLLAGHSLGAVVAFEMARQLEAAGEHIGLLALLDGEARIESALIDTLLLVSDTFELGISRAELAAQAEDEMMQYVLRKSKKRFGRVLEIAYDMDILPRGFRTRDAELFLTRIAANIDLATRYRLQPLRHAAHLFIATDASANVARVDVETWRRYVLGGVTVIPVPGDHMTLIKKPHAQTLAARLAELIEQVEYVTRAPNPDPVSTAEEST
jgi:amino acid adenylation domain-containing protein